MQASNGPIPCIHSPPATEDSQKMAECLPRLPYLWPPRHGNYDLLHGQQEAEGRPDPVAGVIC